MVQKVDRQECQLRFLAALKGASYRFIEGLNPFRILLDGTEYWIYIKNLTSAHFENPDVWRAQLPQRDDFNPIKESGADFILLGYDGENDVYATWNPVWVKQRLNSTGNVSFYSRYSLQEQARKEMTFKRLELSNEGEVVVFPRELIRMFFVNVSSYFLAEGDYVAMGSKRRPEANEAFKTFSDASNIENYARYLADKEMSQVTIGNYCRVIKNLLSDGTLSRNRKYFLQYDFLTEYRKAVPQFVELDEVKEKNEKWHNLISAALNSYIDFLTQVYLDITPEGILPGGGEVVDNGKETPAPLQLEPKEYEQQNGDIFVFFCSERALTDFEVYLSTKNYRYSTVKRYVRAIRFMISSGHIGRHQNLFLSCSGYSEYQQAADKFFTIPDIRAINEHKHHDYSAAVKQYIEYLVHTHPYGITEGPALELHNNVILYGSPSISIEEPAPELFEHDWEAEFTDANGKLTRIANPELIGTLRPYLDTEYPKKAAAFNAIERFYGNRFPVMTLADWGKLMNAINWSDPFIHDNPGVKKASAAITETLEPTKRSKTHILRVEFPDGTIFQDKNVSNTYAKAIEKIDPELVALVELSHAGVGVVSKKLDAKYAQYQKPIGGGWYVMTNSSTTTKCSDLQTISNELDQDLIISLVPLDGSELMILPHKEKSEGARSKIRVTFPDGHVIQPSKVLDALLEVVQFAGIDRVRNLGIICCGDNMILNNPAPRYQSACKPVGNGWLCNTFSNTNTKFSQISDISQKLGLGLKVELI